MYQAKDKLPEMNIYNINELPHDHFTHIKKIVLSKETNSRLNFLRKKVSKLLQKI